MKAFLTFCAICCFVGIFRIPIEYYTFLRILVSVGALIVLYNTLSFKQYYFSIIFLIILILFNPIFPIYLYRKNVWIPIDTVTGILFLLINFVENLEQKKEEEITEEASEHSQQSRVPSRDRIINPKKPKEE
ncbi:MULTISPECIES: DUF6804 family protein [Chryseobacterium]|uniref:DUF6804 family protein n=1 Tax=Chryseobacterium TaxID=59732 RepID=UPI00195EBD9A|nr:MULTISPECIES: DUF6804 family protein [Chryseobacterium]MBM7418276.1 hypothetical protein [Chryseobacterium sp. JUb44]MDH6212483.1 hypothetical protein [Chryseobacterium sp. BIGb0186]WSO11088.1 DUF6804 family protein [Chryseobacterium scophthalmum]